MSSTSQGVLKPTITPNSIVVTADDHVSSDLAGEVVILSLKHGMYYGLDKIGTRIWSLIQAPTTVAAICDTLIAEYDVTPERCERDLQVLLENLATAELIEVHDAANA